jgi:histidinol-phosphate/aromatic aminotransferase/cobyric acid decarboxylase-like protein
MKSEKIRAKFNLSGSTPPLAPFLFQTLENLKTKLARLLKCRPNQVAVCPGSSQAMFQVLAALTDPGDTILIESPTYEPFLAAARFLGLKIRRFRRTGDFPRDLRAIGAKARGAKVLLLSNPHCPMGHLYTAGELAKLGKLGPRLVVDEVFLPLFADGKATQVRAGIISVGGLSKATGLSSLRCGWIRADESTITKINLIGLNLHIDMPVPSLLLAKRAVANWPTLTGRWIKMANANRPAVQAFAKRHPGAVAFNFERGFFFLLKVPKGFSNGRAFAKALLKHSIWLRPGDSFELPQHVRVHALLPKVQFTKVLTRIESYY